MVTFHTILLELICARQHHGITPKKGKYFWRCWMIVWTKSGLLHLSIECFCAVTSTLILLLMARTWTPSLDGLRISSFWSRTFLLGSYCGLSQNFFGRSYTNLPFVANPASPLIFSNLEDKETRGLCRWSVDKAMSLQMKTAETLAIVNYWAWSCFHVTKIMPCLAENLHRGSEEDSCVNYSRFR